MSVSKKPKASKKIIRRNKKNRKVTIKFEGANKSLYYATNKAYHELSPVAPTLLDTDKDACAIEVAYEENFTALSSLNQIYDDGVVAEITMNIKRLHSTKLKNQESVDYQKIYQHLKDNVNDDYIKKELDKINPDFSTLDCSGSLIHGDFWLNNIFISDYKMLFVDGENYLLKTITSQGNPYIDIASFISNGLLRKTYFYKLLHHKQIQRKKIEHIIRQFLYGYFNNEILDEQKLMKAMALTFMSKIPTYENMIDEQTITPRKKRLRVLCEKMTTACLTKKSLFEVLEYFFTEVTTSENEKTVLLAGGTVNDVAHNIEKDHVMKNYQRSKEKFNRDLSYHMYSPHAPKVKKTDSTKIYFEYIKDNELLSSEACIKSPSLSKDIGRYLSDIHSKKHFTKLYSDWKNKKKRRVEKDPLDYSYADVYKTLIKRLNDPNVEEVLSRSSFNPNHLSKTKDYRLVHGDVWPQNILATKEKLYFIDGESYLVKNEHSVGHPYVDLALFIVMSYIRMPIYESYQFNREPNIKKIETSIDSLLEGYKFKIDKEAFNSAIILLLINKISDVSIRIENGTVEHSHLFTKKILTKHLDLFENGDFRDYIRETLKTVKDFT